MVPLDYIRVCIAVTPPSPPSLPPSPPSLPPLPPFLPPSLPPLPSLPPSLPPSPPLPPPSLPPSLNLLMARIIQKALMLTPHSNTDTLGTATCLPVAGCAPPARASVLECLKMKRRRVFFFGVRIWLRT